MALSTDSLGGVPVEEGETHQNGRLSPACLRSASVLHTEAVGWQEGISTNSSVLYTRVSTQPFTEHRER